MSVVRHGRGLGFALTLAVYCLTVGQPVAAQAATDSLDRVRTTVDSVLNARIAEGVPGMVIGVFRDTTPLLVASRGVTSLETSRPYAAAQQQPVASITKQFTAVAILALVDARALSLDDPVVRWVPDLPASHRSLTVRQLLQQYSGLGRVENRFAAAPPANTDSVVRMIARVPPEFAPGTRFAYNNANYILLGAIIEQLTGRTWSEHLYERFFSRLDMSSTSPCAPTPADSLVGYMRAGLAPTARPSLPLSLLGAAGGMCSTVRDLALWVHALHDGRVLSDSSYLALRTPPTTRGSSQQGYAMGMVRSTNGPLTRLWHNGALTSGFNAQMSFYPDDSLTIVVLSNAFPAGVEETDAAVYRSWRARGTHVP